VDGFGEMAFNHYKWRFVAYAVNNIILKYQINPMNKIVYYTPVRLYFLVRTAPITRKIVDISFLQDIIS
jgi:hypothetical protein